MSNVYAVTLLLDCGHKIRVPVPPPRQRRATFACRMSSGCGYRLDWVEAVSASGTVLDNIIMDKLYP
jgi:hypothetical protein